MQQLDVTDDQLAYLESVRVTLESEYLGPYGHVTTQDALQFLIDVHDSTDPDLPSVDVDALDTSTPGTTATQTNGADATTSAEVESEASEELFTPTSTDDADEAEAEADEEATEAAADDEEADGDAEADSDAAGDEDAADADDAETETADTDEDGDETEAGDEGDDSAEEENAGEDSESGSSFDSDTGGNDRLQAMMNLLETHDDKWREDDGEARYEIDLPDGSTETVQTRDDVRAVLFKNYR
ncbi:hypothetical protein ACFPYI_04565 [Halomarina salina]|uniref:Uncharacterized protein n=1 Tax=Halomarina salina TaxID=1872699 RepID=A0ABD5RJR0_9EURY|nr:hypothetical protein [Halomarina salina]